MGILKELTKEYFGEKVRKEDEINIDGLEVDIVSFKDNNGKKYKRGYKPKDWYYLIKLLERMVEVRGDEGDFNDIDTSEIESMNLLFYENKTFNGNISGWNVSKVKDMFGVFHTTSFNQDISKWEFPNVLNMNYMFCNATSFNQDISNWKFPNVEDMSGMFDNATSFNQPIGNWKFPNVKNMSCMFHNTTSFNQPIGDWEFPKVEDMTGMFYNATSFNQNISKWKIYGVFDYGMFENCPIKDEFKPKME